MDLKMLLMGASLRGDSVQSWSHGLAVDDGLGEVGGGSDKLSLKTIN